MENPEPSRGEQVPTQEKLRELVGRLESLHDHYTQSVKPSYKESQNLWDKYKKQISESDKPWEFKEEDVMDADDLEEYRAIGALDRAFGKEMQSVVMEAIKLAATNPGSEWVKLPPTSEPGSSAYTHSHKYKMDLDSRYYLSLTHYEERYGAPIDPCPESYSVHFEATESDSGKEDFDFPALAGMLGVTRLGNAWVLERLKSPMSEAERTDLMNQILKLAQEVKNRLG